MKSLLPQLRLQPFSKSTKTPVNVKGALLRFFLLAGFLFTGFSLFGQQRHYHFSVQGVNDLGSAKEITDVLRPVFNTEAEPFAFFPWFDDNRDVFDFGSTVAVTREQLETVLAQKGLVLTSWVSETYITNSEKQ